VAERICAAPGELSLLALSVQVYGQPQLVAHIPAGAFFPLLKSIRPSSACVYPNH